MRKYYPHSLLHFEDFGVTNAKRLLDIYRDKHAIFNDDVSVAFYLLHADANMPSNTGKELAQSLWHASCLRLA